MASMAMASSSLSVHKTANRTLCHQPFRRLPPGRFASERRDRRRRIGCSAAAAASSQRVSFQGSVTTDLALRESRTVSFEQYMEDEDRIFDALFPDKRRRQKLNDEEWRIFMLPLEFFLLSARPVVDMRVVLKEPPTQTTGSTRFASKLLTLEATRWELRGLDYQLKPSEFDLGINGTLYLEKGGLAPPRLKGQMKLCVELAVPPSLGLMPVPVIENFGGVLLSQLLENMKDRVNTRLLEDYEDYARQKQARLSSA